MPTLLNKIKNRWNASSNEAPSYHIGPITPANHSRWRSRLAKLLGINGTTPLRTASYRPLYQSWFSQPRDLPPFSFETIHSMLMDPGIRLNLAMRAATIYGVQFAYTSGTDASGKTIYQNGVQAANPAVAAWVQRQLNTIWHNDLPAILRSQVYGWVGGEVSLRLSNQNLIEIDKLVARHPGDIRLLKLDGERYGVKVLRVQEGGEVNLEFPSAWFHAFRPDDGEDYGTSILLGAYSPWADKWFNGGALDTRRLFMHKDAYGGMKIAYPEEEIYIGDAVTPVSARDIAAQMVEQRKAGGTITYPSTLDALGNPKWRVEEATTAKNPQHILQYPKDCDDEIRVGMEIPDDVISHDGSGAWAGKRIPLAAFYAGLDTWVVQILADLRKTLEPLILLNWGKAEDFEICHKPLALQAMEAVAPPAAPGAQGEQPGGLSPEIMGAVNNASGSQRMSLRSSSNTTPHATRDQAQDASDRLSPQNRGTANSNRARAIAALLTRIYGPDAESYFDEAYGIETPSDSRHDPDRDPYEFRRLSAYVSRPTSFSRIPWDESKHPRGRDGRFIEKYSADALTHTQQRISESLDPNHVPTTGRTSDDIRGLLDHFNLLDDTQVNTLLDQHQVAPDSTGTNPLTNKLHRQIYGEEPSLQKLPARKDIKPQLQDSVYPYGDDKDQASPFTLLAHHPEESGQNNADTSDEDPVSESGEDFNAVKRDRVSKDDEGFKNIVLADLQTLSPLLYRDLTIPGTLNSLLPATPEAIANLDTIETAWGNLYYENLGGSTFRVFYAPKKEGGSISELDVTRALMSDEFLETFHKHLQTEHDVTASVKGTADDQPFATLDEFKASRKQAFGQAAVIIHDLIIDTVRAIPSGEIPYAIYVMNEDGIAGYVGSRIEETAEGISSAVAYARDNPIKAGTLVVLSIVSGKVVANRKDLKGRQGCDLYLGSRKPSPMDGLVKDMEGKFMFRSIDEIKNWERFVAGAKSLFSASKLLLGNGQFAFKGDLEKARKVISNLTKATGREAAFLVLPDGRKIIRIGDKESVKFGNASNVIAHSHPSGLLMLSDDMQKGKHSDISVLTKTGQYQTYLIGPDGNMVKWESASGKWIDDLIGTIINGIRP